MKFPSTVPVLYLPFLYLSCLDVLKWLVEERKADFNETDGNGMTPALYSVARGDLEMLKWLVEGKKATLDGLSAVRMAAG